MIKTTPLVKIDPWLKPYSQNIKRRYQKAYLKELEITNGEKDLKDAVNNYLYYGLHCTDNQWVFREKAPQAKQVFIYGDFSYWQIDEKYALKSLDNGDWEIKLPLSFLKHGDLYKLWIVWADGADDRLPSHANRVVQDEQTKIYSAQVWNPEKPYSWLAPAVARITHPLIYEAHIGISSSQPAIATYQSFKNEVLPRIKELGYNTIQLMAIQEHPYYGSFGYQVANYYAPSSRFGTPEELMELIDTAHQMGIAVILDVVHSHAVSNVKEGLSRFDGSDDLYFHHGEKGQHPVWDSRCFNYSKLETILFLLSNLKYWMELFHFDGFRFDGVTSMCYWNHGIGVDFLSYAQYFDENVDEDAIAYLTLANKLIKQINKQAFTIAEDVSGLPGLALPIQEGGIGFNYRMSMGIADFWCKTIKELQDEQWHVGEIYFRLTDKRNEEQTISYAESHDQSLVGDKAIIFRLIDKDMYESMSAAQPHLIVDRGIALHKMIRLVTLALANGGYLNFMGNEFGHPEWIDFPREGNNWSFQYAKRQWELADNPALKYQYLYRFDKEMLHFISGNNILSFSPVSVLQNIHDQVLVFNRNDAVFIFNFNPVQSFTDYEIPCSEGTYKIVLNTDAKNLGGFGLIDENYLYQTYKRDGNSYIKLYIPARVGFVLFFQQCKQL